MSDVEVAHDLCTCVGHAWENTSDMWGEAARRLSLSLSHSSSCWGTEDMCSYYIMTHIEVPIMYLLEYARLVFRYII